MIIGIPVYSGVDLLDVAGPYEMLGWVDQKHGFDVRIVSQDGLPVTTRDNLTFSAHCSFAQAPALDVLWVPGGAPSSLSLLMAEPETPYIAYLRQVAAKARFVCSVCEGAMLLAKAGLLDGYRATTHWAFLECLRSFKPISVDPGFPRFVHDRDRLTGGGISSGLDEALKLIELLTDEATAKEVQVTTQYIPKPPVCGEIPTKPEPCPFSW